MGSFLTISWGSENKFHSRENFRNNGDFCMLLYFIHKNIKLFQLHKKNQTKIHPEKFHKTSLNLLNSWDGCECEMWIVIETKQEMKAFLFEFYSSMFWLLFLYTHSFLFSVLSPTYPFDDPCENHKTWAHSKAHKSNSKVSQVMTFFTTELSN